MVIWFIEKVAAMFNFKKAKLKLQVSDLLSNDKII
jgi:hypothetical protein